MVDRPEAYKTRHVVLEAGLWTGMAAVNGTLRPGTWNNAYFRACVPVPR